jgi:hypothetical protein
LPAAPGTGGAYAYRVMELLTGDAGLVIFAAAGIVATAVSILRDAKAQRAQIAPLTEEVPIDLRRAA